MSAETSHRTSRRRRSCMGTTPSPDPCTRSRPHRSRNPSASGWRSSGCSCGTRSSCRRSQPSVDSGHRRRCGPAPSGQERATSRPYRRPRRRLVRMPPPWRRSSLTRTAVRDRGSGSGPGCAAQVPGRAATGASKCTARWPRRGSEATMADKTEGFPRRWRADPQVLRRARS